MKPRGTRLAVVGLAAASCMAQPAGGLDPRYGADGLVLRRLTEGHDLGRAVVPLARGSVVVAAESGGRVKPFLGPDAVLLRLTANGALDRTFGQGGITRIDVGRGSDHVAGAAATPQGLIVAGGAAENTNGDAYGDDAAVYAFRTRPSGRLDPSFGRRGIASVRVPAWTGIGALNGIALSSDGGVVIGASRSTANERNRLVLVHFDRRGRLDRGFGQNGVAVHDVQHPYALTGQRDGRLVVVGMTDVPRRDWFVLRLRRDGRRDPTFGGDGLVVTSFGPNPESARAVVVDPRGRIVVAGYTNSGDSNCAKECDQLRLVRYLSDGRVDTSFGRAGRVAEPVIGLAHDTLGVNVQPDGKVVVAGSSYVAGQALDRQLTLWRFDGRGRLDRTFGAGGSVAANPTTAQINLDFLTAVAVSPAGRIFAAGGASKPTTGFDSTIIYDVAVLRVH